MYSQGFVLSINTNMFGLAKQGLNEGDEFFLVIYRHL